MQLELLKHLLKAIVVLARPMVKHTTFGMSELHDDHCCRGAACGMPAPRVRRD
jgi:hypothetical protein